MVFGTLKPAKRLEQAGPATAQAQGAAFADTIREDPATRQDLTISETALRRDLKESVTELRRDLKESETALRAELQSFRAGFQADLRALGHRTTLRLGTMLAGGIVLVGTMVKLL